MSTVAGMEVELDLDSGKWTSKVGSASSTLRTFESQVASAGNALATMESRLGSGFNAFSRFVIVADHTKDLLKSVWDVIGDGSGSILKTSGNLEKMQVLMEGLSKQIDPLKRKLEGQQGMDFVINMSKSTPFELQAITDSFVKMKTAGLDPTDGSLKALTDEVARFGGTSETLHNASIAIQQMAGKGVVSMEELRRQLGEAVPDAIQRMADGAGMKMAEFVKKISTGQVQATSALKQMFFQMELVAGGSAENMMHTWVGMTSRLKTEWTLFEKSVADAGFMDNAKKAVQDFTSFLSTNDAKHLAVDIGNLLSEIVTGLASVAKWLTQNIESVEKWGEMLLFAFGAAKFASLGSGIVGFFKQISDANKAKSLEMAAQAETLAAKQEAAATAAAEAQVKAEQLAQQAKERTLELTAAAQKEIDEIYVQSFAVRRELVQQQLAFEERAAAAQKVIDTQRDGKGWVTKTFFDSQRQAIVAFEEEAAVAQASAQKISASAAAKAEAVMAAARAQITAEAEAVAAAKAEADALAASLIEVETATAEATSALEIMSGPLGWITLALTAGVAAWGMWGHSAEDEVARAVEAVKKGYATIRDLKTINDQITKAEDQKKAVEGRLSAGYEDLNVGEAGTVATADQLRENDVQALEQINAKIKSLTESSTKAITQIEKDGNEAIVKANKDALQEKFDAINRANQEETIAARKALEDKGLDEKAYTEASLKLNSDFATKRFAQEKSLIEEQKALHEAAFMALSNAGQKDSSYGKALSAELVADAAMLDEINGKLKQAKDAGAGITLMFPKKTGKKSPFEEFLESTDGKIAQLKENLAGLNGLWGKFEAQVADGKYGKLTEQQIAQAKQKLDLEKQLQEQTKARAAATEALNAVTSEETKINAKLDADLAAVGEQLNGNVVKTQTAAMQSLNAQIAIMNEKLVKTGQMWGQTAIDFNNFVESAHAKQATLDGDNFIISAQKQRDAANAASLTNTQDRVRAELQVELDALKVKHDAVVAEAEAEGQDVSKIDQAYYQDRVALINKANLQMRSSFEKLLDDWQDLNKSMQDAWTSSMQSFDSEFKKFVTTGKFSFKDLITSILADIASAMEKKFFAEFISSMISAFGGGGGMTVNAGDAGITGGTTSYTGDPVAFANGGIMTALGALKLNKYANGGIANSPQLAMFGEGRMPEAYVPLPDGRRIPVAMEGGGGTQVAQSNVVINVTNKSGHDVDAQETGRKFDGKQMVLDIVLTAMQKPGGFRDNMRAAGR